MTDFETTECVNSVDNTTSHELTVDESVTATSDDSDDGFTVVKKASKSQNHRRYRSDRGNGEAKATRAAREEVEVPAKPPRDHPVYVVYSRLSLDSIEDFIDEKTGVENAVSFIRVVYDRDSQATNRSIAVIRPDVYKKLLRWTEDNTREVYDHTGRRLTRFNDVDFSISEYKIRDSDRQHRGSPANTLFVPVPSVLRSKQTFVRSYVNQCLRLFVDNNMIPDNCWHINIPLTTRESGGEIRNGCYISFRGVHPDTLALVRVVIDYTFWEHDGVDELTFRCRWLKTRTQKDDKRSWNQKPKPKLAKGSQPKPTGRKGSPSASEASEDDSDE